MNIVPGFLGFLKGGLGIRLVTNCIFGQSGRRVELRNQLHYPFAQRLVDISRRILWHTLNSRQVVLESLAQVPYRRCFVACVSLCIRLQQSRISLCQRFFLSFLCGQLLSKGSDHLIKRLECSWEILNG